jgi:hypothetical protein
MCIKSEYVNAEIVDAETLGYDCYVVKADLANGGTRIIFSAELEDDLELER